MHFVQCFDKESNDLSHKSDYSNKHSRKDKFNVTDAEVDKVLTRLHLRDVTKPRSLD
jgi:polyisoprenoid-binding protein YceI